MKLHTLLPLAAALLSASALLAQDIPWDRSDAGRNAAKETLDAARDAFRNAPAIRDTAVVTLTSRYAGQEHTQDFTNPILLTPDAARIDLNGFILIAVDNTLYATWEDNDERYYALDFQGKVSTSLFTNAQSIFPFPHFPLMFAQDPVAEIFMFCIQPTLAASREVTVDGAKYREILIESAAPDGADVELRFKPDTALPVRFRSLLRDLGADDDTSGVEIIVAMSPEILPAAPLDEFIVDTENRREVSSFAALTAGPSVADLEGQPLLALTLKSPDEQSTLTNDDLAGRVTVFAFWMMASELLLPVRPVMEELAAWADEHDRDLRLAAVAVTVPPDDLANLWPDLAGVDLWTDPDASAARELTIPLCPVYVIVGPDERIAAVHADLQSNEGLAQRLIEDIEAALKRGL